MIKITNTHVMGWQDAIRGMRNPMNSWDKSDSVWVPYSEEEQKQTGEYFYYKVGPKDLDLMHRLFLGGPEHRKFMRFLFVTLDIEAPLYWFKEMDTYKIGVSCNSCSTMHKLHSRDLRLDDFSNEHMTGASLECLIYVIGLINTYRDHYIRTKDKQYWWQMIQLLPSSYNQKRTYSMNYEVAYKIIRERGEHKLDEWREFVELLLDLPYMNDIINGVD